MRSTALLALVALAATPVTACVADTAPAADATPTNTECASGTGEFSTRQVDGIEVGLPSDWTAGPHREKGDGSPDSDELVTALYYWSPSVRCGIMLAIVSEQFANSAEDATRRMTKSMDEDYPNPEYGPVSTVSFAGQEWARQMGTSGDKMLALRTQMSKHNNLWYGIVEIAERDKNASELAFASATSDMFASVEQSFSFPK
ncbi:hypothetical protein ACQPW1_00935 [Nocardia sp. CA-128927]|uniref:hypothetical protein n=1 Tax=Nocardia sp. CA-128927 TaxID=3239975 RepID=UPI003D9650E1